MWLVIECNTLTGLGTTHCTKHNGSAQSWGGASNNWKTEIVQDFDPVGTSADASTVCVTYIYNFGKKKKKIFYSINSSNTYLVQLNFIGWLSGRAVCALDEELHDHDH